ncbi:MULTISPECIES: glycoside hydrolase family 3 C-terminal domain-containing protein [Sphingobium]|uniref:Glycoside hydrolase family 3 C-terminal domain-containing protein n=1 Tax=Sphingobium tyrosinilyticum TaxID=2715436 RepID=A0ABV9EZB6_9SPHN|nr:glycoside hydrolase family 3 C-terminal domain-containing protein [Sphingobium sp. EP60837]ANI80048.1 Beta-glucosidase [Sphingobium sp. EP60837]
MKKSTSLLCLAAMGSMLTPISGQAKTSADTPERRAAETLAKMTPEEKFTLLHGPMPSILPPAKRPQGVTIGAGFIEGVERLGVPRLIESDASLGVSNLMEMRKGDVATALPSGLSLASSWDPEIARSGGVMIGSEARAKGFNVMLVGGVNLVRDPRAGRNFEYLGEDPLLGGVLVGGQIAGVQSNNIIGTIKHFALNNQETGRNVGSVEMDETPMRESDLLAFQIGIERGNPGSVMCAYNRVGGTYACENAFLLNDVLRRDWGFKGFVMSDWGAVHSTEAILAGLDQQSGEQLDGKRYFSDLLVKALQEGKVPQSAVDKAAGRVLYAIYAHGLADNPLKPGQPINYDANAEVAQRAAEQGIVLLRNEGGILPLAASAKKILVVGGNADVGVPGGGGSSQVNPVGGLKRVGKGAESGPAAGFAKRGYGGTAPLDALRAELPGAQISYLDGKDAAAAASAAKAADVVIVFAEKFATEAVDQPDLSLGEGQDALIDAVAGANAKTVVVLETGNAVLMPWRDKVPAILSAWYGGQRGGTAIARILTGKVNPSGHLPVTFPASVDHLPNPVLPGSDAPPADKETRAVYGIQAGTKPFDIRYPEGSDVGYRWFDKKGLKPLYPFGHGLSYTQFRYDGLKTTGGKALTVRFTVTNSGQRAGADVPQVYVTRPGKAKRLVGWAKPDLKPGESTEVTVTADMRVLADFDAKAQRWVLPAEEVKVEVGTSAADPVLTGTAKLNRAVRKP